MSFFRSKPAASRMTTLLPLLASIVAITPLALDMYLPAMLTIADYFHTSVAIVQNSLSVYLAGYAAGLLLFGPMVDSIGRRALALPGLLAFSIASLLLPLCSSVEMFTVLRFIQAFCGSAATVVVPGVIRQFYGKDTAKGMSYVSMIMMLAPLVAPTMGSVIMYSLGWQAMFYFLGAYGISIFTLSVSKLPHSAFSTEPSRPPIDIIGRYKTVFSHQPARKYIITSMLVSLSFFAYLTSIPFIYLQFYQTGEFVFSALFALNIVSFMLAQFFNSRFVSRLGSTYILIRALYLGLLFASLLVLIHVLQLSLVWTVVCIMPLMGSIALIAVNSDALILMEFAEHSGTATAVIGTLRFGIGAAAGPILTFFHNDTPLPFALLMFSSLVLIIYFLRSNLSISSNAKA
ncbi:multidrug effflux MFS transporter [Thalassotalea ponticola]|uniref:multidrug effflux MFS transporter n=1 Tax=Thalassotalea ponticola TaxID=1523392 RepID=UPI0025B4F87D|nr:multidrug effflux MFS transporter [Thalassotalea ponticola]MDN3653694.1 multidrug effflux MFS transporter [Thalassotalea ponticola]